MTDTSQPLFLFGAGYCARALAAIWDGPVSATYRSKESLARLHKLRIDPIDQDDRQSVERAVTGACVLISAAPGDAGCPGFAALGEFATDMTSVTYLSTTGVYGDLGGGWAMEWTPVNAGSKRAERRVQAEQTWQQSCEQVQIVRLPGIYGPGRSQLERVKSGTAKRVVKPGHVFSRAHVDDIAAGLKALMKAKAYGVFNLCDEEAAPPQDVLAYAAGLLGIEPPPEVAIDDADISDMARSFYAECKRVSNARLKAATGWRPTFPTYREGLAAIE